MKTSNCGSSSNSLTSKYFVLISSPTVQTPVWSYRVMQCQTWHLWHMNSRPGPMTTTHWHTWHTCTLWLTGQRSSITRRWTVGDSGWRSYLTIGFFTIQCKGGHSTMYLTVRYAIYLTMDSNFWLYSFTIPLVRGYALTNRKVIR